VVPWAPVAQGLFSGKYVADDPPPPNSRWKGDPKSMAAQRFTRASIAVADKLKAAGIGKGVTLAEFALAWVMNQAHGDQSHPGPAHAGATRERAEGAGRDDHAMKTAVRIDAIVPPGRSVANFYDMNFAEAAAQGPGVGGAGITRGVSATGRRHPCRSSTGQNSIRPANVHRFPSWPGQCVAVLGAPCADRLMRGTELLIRAEMRGRRDATASSDDAMTSPAPEKRRIQLDTNLEIDPVRPDTARRVARLL
jgi:hypothetical protein